MKVRCIKAFSNKKKSRKVGDEWNATKEECALLTSQHLCVVVREEPKKENKKKPTDKVEKTNE